MEKTAKTATRRKSTTATPRATAPRKRTPASRALPGPAPSHEQIAARAHELFVLSGHEHGRDAEFWLEAERQLRKELE